MKTEIKSIRVKILKPFLSPLTNRMTKAGAEINVPQNQFWLKRIEQKDCKKLALKVKKKKQTLKPDENKPKNNKDGKE